MKFTPVMKDITPSAFKFVYIIEMKDSNKNFSLSRFRALEHTGLSKSTYYISLEELYNLGFVKKKGCYYYV